MLSAYARFQSHNAIGCVVRSSFSLCALSHEGIRSFPSACERDCQSTKGWHVLQSFCNQPPYLIVFSSAPAACFKIEKAIFRHILCHDLAFFPFKAQSIHKLILYGWRADLLKSFGELLRVQLFRRSRYQLPFLILTNENAIIVTAFTLFLLPH